MSKFNKEFEYKRYKFNTLVELNTRVERTPNGKVFHTIITNCMDGNNYYLKHEIESSEIEKFVALHKQSAIDYVDKLSYKSQSTEEILLEELGFK